MQETLGTVKAFIVMGKRKEVPLGSGHVSKTAEGHVRLHHYSKKFQMVFLSSCFSSGAL
jgi:hypothetical protein